MSIYLVSNAGVEGTNGTQTNGEQTMAIPTITITNNEIQLLQSVCIIRSLSELPMGTVETAEIALSNWNSWVDVVNLFSAKLPDQLRNKFSAKLALYYRISWINNQRTENITHDLNVIADTVGFHIQWDMILCNGF